MRPFGSKRAGLERTDDYHRGGGEVRGLDAPGLGIEVVGAGTDVLDGTEGDVKVGDGHDATRGVGREDEGLATEIFKSVLIGKVDAWVVALR